MSSVLPHRALECLSPEISSRHTNARHRFYVGSAPEEKPTNMAMPAGRPPRSSRVGVCRKGQPGFCGVHEPENCLPSAACVTVHFSGREAAHQCGPSMWMFPQISKGGGREPHRPRLLVTNSSPNTKHEHKAATQHKRTTQHKTTQHKTDGHYTVSLRMRCGPSSFGRAAQSARRIFWSLACV